MPGFPDGYPRQIQSGQSAENSHTCRSYAEVVYARKDYCRRSGYEQQAQGYQTDVAALAAARRLTPVPLAIPTSHHSSPLSRCTSGGQTLSWYGTSNARFTALLASRSSCPLFVLSTAGVYRRVRNEGRIVISRHHRRRHWSWY